MLPCKSLWATFPVRLQQTHAAGRILRSDIMEPLQTSYPYRFIHMPTVLYDRLRYFRICCVARLDKCGDLLKHMSARFHDVAHANLGIKLIGVWKISSHGEKEYVASNNNLGRSNEGNSKMDLNGSFSQPHTPALYEAAQRFNGTLVKLHSYYSLKLINLASYGRTHWCMSHTCAVEFDISHLVPLSMQMWLFGDQVWRLFLYLGALHMFCGFLPTKLWKSDT